MRFMGNDYFTKQLIRLISKIKVYLLDTCRNKKVGRINKDVRDLNQACEIPSEFIMKSARKPKTIKARLLRALIVGSCVDSPVGLEPGLRDSEWVYIIQRIASPGRESRYRAFHVGSCVVLLLQAKIVRGQLRCPLTIFGCGGRT